MPTRSIHTDGRNRLLEVLPRHVRTRVTASMDLVTGSRDDVVVKGQAPITHVFFPTAGIISLGVTMAGGRTSEVGMVGNEGMVGLPLVNRTQRHRVGAWYTVRGAAMRMPAGAFADELRRNSEFAAVLHRYSEAVFNQLAQSVACGRWHSLEQRFCRWILMSSDRIGGAPLSITQAELAQIIGVRRASINAVALALQQAGVVSYSRGVVRVLEPRGLEARACECYGIGRQDFERLLQPGRKLAGRR